MPDMASTERPDSRTDAGTPRPATPPTATTAAAARRMPLTAVKSVVRPGSVWDVTNHRIAREDDPCYGTTRRVVTRTAGNHFYLSVPPGNGERRVGWPRAAQVEMDPDGIIRLRGGTGQQPGEVYLTLVPVKDQPK